MHLWVGIVLTVYMIVIGLTGSILVFRPELERLCGLKPWQEIHAKEPIADIATVVEELRAGLSARPYRIGGRPGENEATFVAVVEGAGHGSKSRAIRTTARSWANFQRRRTWLDVTQELHESLLIHPGSQGRMLNGIGAASLLLLNVTGMVIWWPGIRNWKRALKVDFRRNWRRINWDLHSAAGFWTILIASFWAVSGIYFAWPQADVPIREFAFARDHRASAGDQRGARERRS